MKNEVLCMIQKKHVKKLFLMENGQISSDSKVLCFLQHYFESRLWNRISGTIHDLPESLVIPICFLLLPSDILPLSGSAEVEIILGIWPDIIVSIVCYIVWVPSYVSLVWQD